MTPVYNESGIQVYHGDALAGLKALPDESAQTVVASPPYCRLASQWLDAEPRMLF
jgi:DNA modification methylase